ncbi:MAG TPA: acetate uptake transporter [Candidatus Limnocylindrales bacterium]|nr:acetate uptake transporter [Candidatus Limnocylindrales bacterium]
MAEASEVERPAFSPVADPAPLGLAAFALTTFLLSGHSATFIPDGIWVGVALFYGGVIQLLAGMWEFRNRNVFGSTAFSTYGGFWLSLGILIVLMTSSSGFSGLFKGNDLENSLAWFLIAFAIFNTYMLLWSTRVNLAVFGVFATLEAAEIVLAIGYFRIAHGESPYVLHVGGWIGIATAAVAWYASAAGVVNGMAPRRVLPVGRPIWGELPALAQPTSPMPRRTG